MKEFIIHNGGKGLSNARLCRRLRLSVSVCVSRFLFSSHRLMPPGCVCVCGLESALCAVITQSLQTSEALMPTQKNTLPLFLSSHIHTLEGLIATDVLSRHEVGLMRISSVHGLCMSFFSHATYDT